MWNVCFALPSSFLLPQKWHPKESVIPEIECSGACFYHLLVFKLTFQKSQFLAAYLEDSPLPSLADRALFKGSC